MNDLTYSSLKIENIVASGGIADSLDIEDISSRLDGCVLNKTKFPGAVYHMTDPKIVGLLFSTGKIVLTGIRSREQFHEGLGRLIETLTKLGVKLFDSPEVIITNMVCSYDSGEKINLNKIAITFNLENIEYEPEQFPGLVYRIPEPKTVALLFTTGKIIITGGKNIEDVKSAIDVLTQKLSEVR